MESKSTQTFLALRISQGGLTHDRIKDIRIVLVENNEVKENIFRTIKPPRNERFSEERDWSQKTDAPTLDTVWEEIKHYFDKVDYVVAHNLATHKSNLEMSLAVYGIPLPNKKYVCTSNWGRLVFPNVFLMPKSLLGN